MQSDLDRWKAQERHIRRHIGGSGIRANNRNLSGQTDSDSCCSPEMDQGVLWILKPLACTFACSLWYSDIFLHRTNNSMSSRRQNVRRDRSRPSLSLNLPILFGSGNSPASNQVQMLEREQPIVAATSASFNNRASFEETADLIAIEGCFRRRQHS
jgi:hypothetical protein